MAVGNSVPGANFKEAVRPVHEQWVRPFYVSLVKTYLLERCIQFKWFMNQTGTSGAQFSKFETGKRNPSPNFRAAAALVLQVPASQLFVKVLTAKRESIIYERDELEPRRILRVLVQKEAGNGKVVEEEVWSLDTAPWKAIEVRY